MYFKVLILIFYHEFIHLYTFQSNTPGHPPASTGPTGACHRLASLPAEPEKVKKLYATSIL